MASLDTIKRRLDRLDGSTPDNDRRLFFITRELAAEAGENGPGSFRHAHVLIEALPARAAPELIESLGIPESAI